MEAAMRKIGTLCGKDFPDLVKNPVMLITALFPILFIIFFKVLFGDIGEGMPAEEAQQAQATMQNLLYIAGVCMTAGAVSGMVILYSIAEEKERHTLRTLMLANVSGGQILVSKAIVALAVTVVVDLVIFFIIGSPMDQLPLYVVIVTLGTIPIILFSLLLGVSARDQMSAGLYSFPVIIVAILPMFGLYSADIYQVVKWTPCGGMADLMELLAAGNVFTQDAIMPLVVTFAWIAVMLVLFLLFYKRLGRDN